MALVKLYVDGELVVSRKMAAPKRAALHNWSRDAQKVLRKEHPQGGVFQTHRDSNEIRFDYGTWGLVIDRTVSAL